MRRVSKLHGRLTRPLAVAWRTLSAASIQKVVRAARVLLLLTSTGLVGACASLPGTSPVPFPGSVSRVQPPDVHVTAVVRIPELVETALALRGSPYRLGGTDPTSGFDCSGFVRFVFGSQAVALPRTVAQQFDVGRRIQPDDLSAGDLLFFATTSPAVTHVGIVVDRHTFVHAPGTGAVVRTERFETPYWQKRLVGMRRVAEREGG